MAEETYRITYEGKEKVIKAIETPKVGNTQVVTMTMDGETRIMTMTWDGDLVHMDVPGFERHTIQLTACKEFTLDGQTFHMETQTVAGERRAAIVKKIA